MNPLPPRGVVLSTHEVLALLDGRATYRQIDYWIRSGRITIANTARGSGAYRTFTRVEVEALIAYVDVYERHTTLAAQFASGQVWRELIDPARQLTGARV